MDAVECIPEGSILSKYSARLYAMAPGTVFINEDGERFVDEAATRKTISEALIKQVQNAVGQSLISGALKDWTKASRKISIELTSPVRFGRTIR